MDHAARMRVGDGLTDLQVDLQETLAVGGAVLAFREERGERAALDELHREIGTARALEAEVVDGHDAGVLELAADLRLLDESIEDRGVAEVVLAQELHRDVAAEVRVAALLHHADAAARDLA